MLDVADIELRHRICRNGAKSDTLGADRPYGCVAKVGAGTLFQRFAPQETISYVFVIKNTATRVRRRRDVSPRHSRVS
jgi:hypothetical protein